MNSKINIKLNSFHSTHTHKTILSLFYSHTHFLYKWVLMQFCILFCILFVRIFWEFFVFSIKSAIMAKFLLYVFTVSWIWLTILFISWISWFVFVVISSILSCICFTFSSTIIVFFFSSWIFSSHLFFSCKKWFSVSFKIFSFSLFFFF